MQEKSLDHWLRRIWCATGLHSQLMEEEVGEAGLALGPAAGGSPPPYSAVMDDGLSATRRNEVGGSK